MNFLNIVDIDDDMFKDQVTRELASRLGDGDYFRFFIMLVIFLSSVFVGLQVDPEWTLQNATLVGIAEAVFLGIFIMEILVKWYYGFINFWKSAWNIFDFVLVSLTILGPSK